MDERNTYVLMDQCSGSTDDTACGDCWGFLDDPWSVPSEPAFVVCVCPCHAASVSS